MTGRGIERITVETKDLVAEAAELVIVPVSKGETQIPEAWRDALGGESGPVGVLLGSGDFRGDLAATALAYGASDTFPRVLLLGLGATDQLDGEKIRKAAAAAARQARDLGVKSARFPVPYLPESVASAASQAEWAAEGAVLGTYRFDGPKARDPEKEKVLGSLVFCASGPDLEKAVRRGSLRAQGTCFARDLGHTPANLLTPTVLAEKAKEIASESGLSLRILEKEDAEKLGMGAFLGVARGSDEPPKFIVLEYKCGRSGAPKIAIVGKGVTFDTGGISLKPPAKMDEMKYDMCGAAAVLGTMKVVKDLELPVDVVAVVPAVENLPSGRATKPGDVHKSYSGKTIEILNTDAEGRLILADAITWVAREHKPAAIVDIATLTGAVIIALGHYGAAVLSNDDELAQRLDRAAATSGERVWRLPIWEEYPDHLKSPFADLKNMADTNAGAGTIAGGAFLREFAENVPWAHVDIAGTAWWDKDRPHIPKGASGFGVRLFLDLLEGYAR